MDYEDELDHNVDSIIAQIKNQGKTIKNVEKERPELKKEDLEKFIIDNAALVVADSIEMIQGLKVDVMAGGDSRMVEATAELVKSVTGAIDSLSKLKLSDDKIKGQKELKKMDIDSKNIENSIAGQSGIYLSREEVIKNLFSKTEQSVIDGNPTIDI